MNRQPTPAKASPASQDNTSQKGTQRRDTGHAPPRFRPRRACILVADDEPAIVDVLTALFEDAGYEVIRAFEGKQALALARARRPDAIVSDVSMPGLSGQELANRVRAANDLPTIPVILMSAVATPEQIATGTFVSKPFDLEDLLKVVEAVAPPTPKDHRQHDA